MQISPCSAKFQKNNSTLKSQVPSFGVRISEMTLKDLPELHELRPHLMDTAQGHKTRISFSIFTGKLKITVKDKARRFFGSKVTRSATVRHLPGSQQAFLLGGHVNGIKPFKEGLIHLLEGAVQALQARIEPVLVQNK